MMAWRIGVPLLTFVLLLCSVDRCRGDDKEAVKVDARDLLMAFKKDPKDAAKQYKGKVIEVTGVFSHSLGSTAKYLELEGGTDVRGHVRCAFTSDVGEELKKSRDKLKKGVKVSIVGTCNGLLGDVAGTVQVDNCKVPTIVTK